MYTIFTITLRQIPHHYVPQDMMASILYDRGNCRSENIIYKATVTSDLEKKFYIGLCSTQFRFLYANHKKYFKADVYENENELSKYVCGLKR